ncbi:RidA family protein [Sphingomonas sp. URHD0057]|uniref:RidA family protein n=1 Tax=Sphingomonas sp. URHD0057 TaxID=1380389 RepID=UPI000565B8F4|nr:RidA family protein [Sphingomonas sp. URHD0057]
MPFGHFRIIAALFLCSLASPALSAEMNTPEQKLAAAGYKLPNPDVPEGNYVSAVRAGNLLFFAGHGECGRTEKLGKVGADLTIEEGRHSAELTALCMLATAKEQIGELSRIERFVRIFGMVNATEDFAQSPKVIDGFSNVMTTAFGEGGKAARAAIVIQSLPGRIPVEVEAIALLRADK